VPFGPVEAGLSALTAGPDPRAAFGPDPIVGGDAGPLGPRDSSTEEVLDGDRLIVKYGKLVPGREEQATLRRDERAGASARTAVASITKGPPPNARREGVEMKGRYLQGLGLLAAIALALSGGTALAATGTAPHTVQTNVTFKSGVALPSPGTRFDGAYVASTNRVYFLGWRLADNTTSGEVWYYDVASKQYVDTGTAMPSAVSNYSVAPLNDAGGVLGLYIFGGRTDDNGGTIVADVQVYYPGSNTAVKLGESDAWPGTTPSGCVSLPAMGVAAVNGKAIVMGGVALTANGCVADENSAQTWVFDPTRAAGNKWSKGPDLTMARGYITTAVLQSSGSRHRDTIYAIGGDVNDAGSLLPQTIVERWKLGNAGWVDNSVADLPEACDESQAFAFNTGPLKNTITLAGCGQWPNALADVLQYDAAGDTWSTVGALLEARRNQAGANIGADKNPKLLVVGGYDASGGTTLASSEIGTVAKGSYLSQAPRVIRGSVGRPSLL
jgi:hypothetical protein